MWPHVDLNFVELARPRLLQAQGTDRGVVIHPEGPFTKSREPEVAHTQSVLVFFPHGVRILVVEWSRSSEPEMHNPRVR
jgi:hypothetical protein